MNEKTNFRRTLDYSYSNAQCIYLHLLLKSFPDSNKSFKNDEPVVLSPVRNELQLSLICETSANATEKKLRAIICHSHTFRRNRQLDAFVAWFHYCGELGSGLFPLRFSRDRYITSKMTVYIFRQPDCSRTWVTPSSTLTRPQTAIFELFSHAFSAAQA